MTQTMQAKLYMNCETCRESWISSNGLHAKLFAILTALLTVFKCSYFKGIIGQVLTPSTNGSSNFVLFDRRLSSTCPNVINSDRMWGILADCCKHASTTAITEMNSKQ